jgi:hypothetical protein
VTFREFRTIIAIYYLLLLDCQNGSRTGKAEAKNTFPRTNPDRIRHEAVSPGKIALRKVILKAVAGQKRVKVGENARKATEKGSFFQESEPAK